MGQMTEQEKDNCALDYLIDKYAEKFADEFEIQDSKYADFFYGADIFYIRSKKLADDLIKVEHLKGVYTDNYIALYYLKQCQRALKQIFTPDIGECTVVCDPEFYTTDEFSSDTTFDEFIHSNTSRLSSNIIIKDVINFNDSNFDNILEKIKKFNIPHTTLHFMVLNEYQEFENAYQLRKVVREERYPYVKSRYIALNKDYEVTRRDEGPKNKLKKEV